MEILTREVYAAALRRLSRQTIKWRAQDALQQACLEWVLLPQKPANPTGWLIRRGWQRLVDARRADEGQVMRARLLDGCRRAADPDTSGADWWVSSRALERAGALAAVVDAATTESRSRRSRALARVRTLLQPQESHV